VQPRRRNTILLILPVLVLTAGAVLVIVLLSGRPLPPTPIVITATPIPPSPPVIVPGQPTPTYRRFFPDLPVPTRSPGLGISVAPHLPARPDLLTDLGMTWVKVYDTPQIADYPGQHVLFRVNIDPVDLDGWERGLYDLAPELARRGAEAVEIGNEANLAAEWGGPPDPARFADALCRAYRAFKQTAPQITVVSGGLAPTDTMPDGRSINDLDFARRALDAGAGDCFDAWGYHAYGFDQPPEADPFEHEMSFRRAERMYRLLNERGLGERGVWITEFGWLRDPREEGVDCSGDANFVNFEWMVVSRDTQAVYTARAVAYAADNWPWAGPLFVWNLNWNLYEPSYEPTCSHLRWYGILDSSGTPLPIVHAMQQIKADTSP
jgi:hypothetical protein